MGHYTTYKGKVEGTGPIMDKFMDDAHSGDAFGDSNWSFPLLDFTEEYINDGESMTWYEHEIHVLGVTMKYPNLLFTLEGEGEETGDIWKKYFRNGKMVEVRAVVTFPEVDLDKELPKDDTVEREVRELQRRKLEEELSEIQRKLQELDA